MLLPSSRLPRSEDQHALFVGDWPILHGTVYFCAGVAITVESRRTLVEDPIQIIVLPGLLKVMRSHSRAEPDDCSACVERVPYTGARHFICRGMDAYCVLCSALPGKRSYLVPRRGKST
jgi:hypothetical protein